MPAYINVILDGSGASIVRAMIQNPKGVPASKSEYMDALKTLASVINNGSAEERCAAAEALLEHAKKVNP